MPHGLPVLFDLIMLTAFGDEFVLRISKKCNFFQHLLIPPIRLKYSLRQLILKLAKYIF
jgi:hypothetical protein